MLITTRFNENTWNENKSYRNKHNIPCIYPVSQMYVYKIPINSWLFVVEMNNSFNRIEGIGLIKNRIYFDKDYNVYSDKNYNRYCYKGEYYLTRDCFDAKIMETLEVICFKGKGHLKRGHGFTRITDKLLANHTDFNIIALIQQTFISLGISLQKKKYI
jgi:hypothetical protein